MSKPIRPNKKQISQGIRSCLTIDLPDGEIDELIEECDEFCTTSFDAGYSDGLVDGATEYENDNPPINEEKSNTEFVTAQFADCKTLSEFQEKYNEIRNRSYNFM